MRYTGIGSRDITQAEFATLIKVGTLLANNGYILRSGKAAGSDTAFQLGMQQSLNQQAEIYLPWAKFRSRADGLQDTWDICNLHSKCFELAALIHPAWHRCSQPAKCLHARNTQQILGLNLDSPSKFVVYCSNESGGTATAVNLAKAFQIPTINIRHSNWNVRLYEVLKCLESSS